MESWVRKLLAIPVVTVALICVVAAIGSAQARNDTDMRGLNHVPLRGSGINTTIRSVVLHHKGQTYLLETRNGLEVRNQHRLPLARVPLLGQLAAPPFERQAFAEEHWVAEVTGDNNRLFVDLPDSAELPARVVIFNQNNAFFLRGGPAPQTGSIPLAGTPIANAYYQHDGGNLLIMVRPSIILDGGVF